MQKFETISKPAELDFYTISDQDGTRMIHIHGYTYKGDGHWASIECCGLIESLADFVRHLRTDADYVGEALSAVKQYQNDYDEDQTVQLINGYFGGRPADHILPYGDITEETPCGHYVC